MKRTSYRDYSTISFPCEFLHGTLRAYLVKIQDKEIFLPRNHTTKLENAVRIPLWLAQKEGLV